MFSKFYFWHFVLINFNSCCSCCFEMFGRVLFFFSFFFFWTHLYFRTEAEVCLWQSLFKGCGLWLMLLAPLKSLAVCEKRVLMHRTEIIGKSYKISIPNVLLKLQFLKLNLYNTYNYLKRCWKLLLAFMYLCIFYRKKAWGS